MTLLIVKLLKQPCGDSNLDDWQKFVVERQKNPVAEVQIAVVGKYIALQDAYKSIYESLVHGAIANNVKLIIKREH